MRKPVFVLAIFAFFSLLVFQVDVLADGFPAGKKLRMKKWKPPGSGVFLKLLAWDCIDNFVKGDKNIAMLVREMAPSSAPGTDVKYNGYVALVDENGKVIKYYAPLTYNDLIPTGQVVPLNHSGGRFAALFGHKGENSEALVGSSYTYDINNGGEKFSFEAWRENKVPEDSYVDSFYTEKVLSQPGQGSFGAVINRWEKTDEFYGPFPPVVFFMEYLFGAPCNMDTAEVKLGVKGKYYSVKLGGPARFNGEDYYPLPVTTMETYSNEDGTRGVTYTGNALQAFVGVKFKFLPPAKKIRARRVASNDLSMRDSYRWPRFLPDSIDSKNVVLFYQLWEHAYGSLDSMKVTNYLQPVSNKGKPVGKPVAVNVPAWKHKLKYDPDKYNKRYSEILTNMVPLGDSRYLYVAARSLARASRGAPSAEPKPGGKPKDTEVEAQIFILDLAKQQSVSAGALKVKFGEDDFIHDAAILTAGDDLIFYLSVYNRAKQRYEPRMGFSTKSKYSN